MGERGFLFPALPGRLEWMPLKVLENSTNFTLYSDEQFRKIQSAYLAKDRAGLSKHLRDAYKTIAGKPMQKAHKKTFYYPSTGQLYAEKVLFQFPFIKALLLLYLLSIVANPLLGLSFALHTGVLLLRSYVLYRPPVTNMYETLLFVPWVICLIGLIMKKKRIPAITASLLFLTLLFLTDKFENVQAVLDSQMWLMIHVLMVVSSYAFFIFAAALAHLSFFRKQSGDYLIHSLYIGTGLLIVGTILGGVWAAQSWGRFWDWDPKESWAFISACFYLILIHLYRFKHIGDRGLSIGAILGLQAITFTWYGVNYILGTGLHSYGFGSGGTKFYIAFILVEIGFVLSFNRRTVKILP